MNGVITKLMQEKSFGFIKDAATGVEHFFHRSAVKTAGGFENLKEGQAVTFEDAPSAKGPRAEEVR